MIRVSQGPVRRTRGFLGGIRRWVHKVLRVLGWIVVAFWAALALGVAAAVTALIQADAWCGGPGTCATLVTGVAIGALIGDVLAFLLLVTITSYWFRIYVLGRSVDKVLGPVAEDGRA